MLGTQLAELLDGAPEAVGDALDLVAGFDEALVHGFARLAERDTAALAALAGAVAATPLAERVGEAVEKLAAGSVSEEHLAALAGARTALFGAVHDALLARADAALGRTRPAWVEPVAGAGSAPEPGAGGRDGAADGDEAGDGAGGGGGAGGGDANAAGATPSRAANLLAGCRSWLHELALTGWRGVDHDVVSAPGQMIEALLAEPGLRRLAVLLDGLVAELRASCPVATMDRLPVRRWADLWARALLLAQPTGPLTGASTPGAAGAAGTVSGRLLVLGVDVHEYGTAVQVQVHGILEPTGDTAPRLVRTSVAAGKVDTITGPAVWRLLRGCPVLLGALAEHRVLELTDVPLLASGDLVWHDDRARAGETADPFATARVRLAAATAPAVSPLERHPVRIAEPVLIEGYATAVDGSGALALELDGHRLPVAVDRLPTCGPLTPDLVAASSACLGLIRWDGGRWAVQPLAVQVVAKRKTTVAHNGDWALGLTDAKAAKSGARTGDAVAVLRERAGRLLRR